MTLPACSFDPDYTINPEVRASLQRFYRRVIKALRPGGAAQAQAQAQTQTPPVQFITVSHMVPYAPEFLGALKALGEIRAVIPKTSARDANTLAQVRQLSLPVVLEDDAATGGLSPREFLSDPLRATAFVHAHSDAQAPCIILDHGGYFAPALSALEDDAALRGRLLGVVEATESGHQRYIEAVKTTPMPVISRARSILKKADDYNVGPAVVHSAEHVMRRVGYERMHNRRIGVIGFGKIGQSIATQLQRLGLNVYVEEIRPEIAVLAAAMGFNLANHDKILDHSDVIFCTTGNQAIKGDEFGRLRDNVFIASAASADDEFGLDWLHAHYRLVFDRNGDQIFVDASGEKHIHLIAGGNAANFRDHSILGPTLFLTEAELIAAACQLMEKSAAMRARNAGFIADERKQNRIDFTDWDKIRNIARIWLDAYHGYTPDRQALARYETMLGHDRSASAMTAMP